MATCLSCGSRNPDGARFCNACATPLGVPASSVAEERKVVTIVFCDLVNFTARSEVLDPEDVRGFLLPYYDLLTSETERHGGTIDKFLGDGAMAVFGVPVVHEDAPERAVRMAIRVLERIPELNLDLHARIGIDTGEVVVASDALDRGDLITGGAVNTASRLQTVAPIDGAVVGERTWEATAAVFDYEELEPATLKGKIEPVRVFQAKSPRARVGKHLTRMYDTTFIGRETSLTLLRDILDETVDANSPHLVTVVGEPGIGKSRIVAELSAHVDDRPGEIVWRHGRCLPYGEDITFWALGEIVKAHAGILESDAPGAATGKLDAVLPEGDERAWFRQRLLPLLGIQAKSAAEREEQFTAWRRFLEYIAAPQPTVLVFEDLHWADDAMLAFLEHLADRAEAVPLLVVGTARPEFFDIHPEFTNGLHNTSRVNLAPLTAEEIARLVSALLGTDEVPVEIQQPILERAGGNPLYAEEFVRLLRDRALVVKNGTSWELREGAEVPFPGPIQALIAARLDMLTGEAKSILADAAVVGKVFWAGAIAEMGQRDLEGVNETLQELSRKELVHPVTRSSIEGEAEYAFWHILARDVAYGELPRAARSSRHVAAARWIESKAPERVEDLADVLAYHYASALELALAAGDIKQADLLQERAIQFLTLAGARAIGLDTAAALGHYRHALALAPEGHHGRPALLVRFAEAAQQAGHQAESVEAFEAAIDAFRAQDDPASAADAMAKLGSALFGGEDPRTWTLPAEALSLLEPMPPGPELVATLTEVAGVEILSGKPEDGIRHADQALSLAEELGLERPGRALGFRGMGRGDLGEATGLEDMREALQIAMEAGHGHEAGVLYNNLGIALAFFEGPEASLRVLRSGIAFARARGLDRVAEVISATLPGMLIDRGDFDEGFRIAGEVADRSRGDDVAIWRVQSRAHQVRIQAFRGHAAQVAGSLSWLESAGRAPGAPDVLVTSLTTSAFARWSLGQRERSVALLEEITATASAHGSPNYAGELPLIVRTALALNDRQLAERLAEGVEVRDPYSEHALVAVGAALAEASGDLDAAEHGYADAEARFGRFRNVPERAFALLGRGRVLLAQGRPLDARSPLRQAREIFESLGAAPAIAETEALLQQAMDYLDDRRSWPNT